MKRFNVTGLCVPHKHYMADTRGKMAAIKKLVEDEKYFTINKGRQYGKTTMLILLKNELKEPYIPIFISFEGLCDKSFESQEAFSGMLMRRISKALAFTSAPEEYIGKWIDEAVTDFELLGEHITKMCRGKKVVLMIDEVDRTSNNRVFLQFIGMLRDKYLAREAGMDFTFHSVILAGVHDIKNIKLKLINEGAYTPTQTEGKMHNSPWNIAVSFDVDMSFNPTEIAFMLEDYEKDHRTGMDIAEIAEEIHKFTSGYPFLVSRICQHIDEKLGKNWTIPGIKEAVKEMLDERNTLFDDIFKNAENNKKLHDMLYDIVIVGDKQPFSMGNPEIATGMMYGMLKNINGRAAVSNRVFETLLSDYFISKNAMSGNGKKITKVLHYDVTKDGRLDMELLMRKFAEHYTELFNKTDAEFLERHGRLIFLTYLKPLINGQGFYHMESQFTDLRRMDIVVDFGKEQFIVELKLWHGEGYKKKAYAQLLDYMKSKNADIGYMLTFDFRKNAGEKPQPEWVEFDGKRIFDVVV